MTTTARTVLIVLAYAVAIAWTAALLGVFGSGTP